MAKSSLTKIMYIAGFMGAVTVVTMVLAVLSYQKAKDADNKLGALIFPTELVGDTSDGEFNVTTIASFDFTGVANASKSIPSNFTAFSLGSYTANDTIAFQSDGYLRLNSSAFTVTITPNSAVSSIEHEKAVYLFNTAINIPSGGSVTCSSSLRISTLGLALQPFSTAVGDSASDYRLASGVLTTGDDSTSLSAKFLVTATKIYTYYGRSTLSRTASSNYAAFSFVKFAAPTSANTFHDYSIKWDKKDSSITWILDGKTVRRITDTGRLISRDFMAADRGGVEEGIFPQSVKCGFGMETFLDHYPPCVETVPTADSGLTCIRVSAEQTGLVLLDTGVYLHPHVFNGTAAFVNTNANATYRDFGQGGILDVKDFLIQDAI